MDERTARAIIHVGSPVFFASLASIPVLYLQDYPELMAVLLGSLYGWGAIHSMIRWINRRHDPRHQKPPPDHP